VTADYEWQNRREGHDDSPQAKKVRLLP
jgi:hypothetical protein